MGVHAGEPDGGSPAEGAADGPRPGLWHLQGCEEERRAMLTDRQPGGCHAHVYVLPLRFLCSGCISLATCAMPAVRVPVLPVSCQGPVQEDELQEG